MITYVSFFFDKEIDSIYNFWPKKVFPRSREFLSERSIFHRMFPHKWYFSEQRCTWTFLFFEEECLSKNNLCLKGTYSVKVSFLPTNHIYPKIVFAGKRYLRETMILRTWFLPENSVSHREFCLPKNNQSSPPQKKQNRCLQVFANDRTYWCSSPKVLQPPKHTLSYYFNTFAQTFLPEHKRLGRSTRATQMLMAAYVTKLSGGHPFCVGATHPAKLINPDSEKKSGNTHVGWFCQYVAWFVVEGIGRISPYHRPFQGS